MPSWLISFLSFGSLIWTIIQVILSVPVPSDYYMSPFAIPWSIISSIINEVSPGSFGLRKGSDCCFLGFNCFFGLKDLIFYTVWSFFNCKGPLSRRVLTNSAAYSFVKQSHIPSQAIIMKSCSACIYTFLTSGNEETKCFLLSSILR